MTADLQNLKGAKAMELQKSVIILLCERKAWSGARCRPLAMWLGIYKLEL